MSEASLAVESSFLKRFFEDDGATPESLWLGRIDLAGRFALAFKANYDKTAVVSRLQEQLAPNQLVDDSNQSDVSREQAQDDQDSLKRTSEQHQLEDAVAEASKPVSWLARFKSGLKTTRSQLSSGLFSLFSTGRAVDDEFYDQLEMQLIMADVGVQTTEKLITDLKTFAKEEFGKATPDQVVLKRQLKQQLLQILTSEPIQGKGDFLQSEAAQQADTKLLLIVGVNGVGKTTTIGKLARQYSDQGERVMLAAGDTFRAAAVEQLKIWGERNQVPVVAQDQGSDSASVIFDALQSARAKSVDLLIADTAGRLHNKSNLMAELQKIVRVLKKVDPTAPHEVLLVLDGCTGQNAISQAKEFLQAVDCTGLVITKLDGTAKGGIVFALADTFNLPVRFVGLGEGVEDLAKFDPETFVDALMDESAES